MYIYIVGPTASGKTALAIELASHLSTEIISADSRQCYKHMDIGTAKPSAKELSTITHYNISLFEPDYKDNAEKFYQRTNLWLAQSKQSDWIFCGGSTLYIQTLLFPLDNIPPSDQAIHQDLMNELSLNGIQQLYQELVQSDPSYAKQMDGMNTQRILRALNIIRQTKRPFSSFHQRSNFVLPSNSIVFALTWERDTLNKRISDRVEVMIESGLVDEVRHLTQLGYDENTYAMNTVGYKEGLLYLKGAISLTEMKELIILNTRRYAKRQVTWFKRYPFLHWINLNEVASPHQRIKDVIHEHSIA
jgi:tRNA dimethylallyltransferase